MAEPLKILHTADSHIGAQLPERPRHDRPRRGDDIVSSFRRVLQLSLRHRVDLVLHGGDLFDIPAPGSRALMAAAEPLLELAVAGIPVAIVPGNHERSSIPGNLFLSHPNIHLFDRPATRTYCLRGRSLAVSGFPCLRRDSAVKFPAALAATEWEKAKAELRVLMLHETFEGATCGPANYRFRRGDNVLEREVVPLEFDYVACGHVHRHQVLAGDSAVGPPIVYAGSPDRISFAEASEPKGAVLIELDGKGLQHRFVEHDVRPMSVLPVVVTDLSRNDLRDQVESVLRALPPRAVAQIRLSGTCEAGVLRGVSFGALAREIRPDLLLTVASQAVEFGRSAVTPKRLQADASVLEFPGGDSGHVLGFTREQAGRVPIRCGVYALSDAADRLLYIGKAKNLRSRIRTHLRGKTDSSFFRGWTRNIRHIEVNPTASELEALLMEAELIRRRRPPFNRQMRRWAGYCYLVESAGDHGQLEVAGRWTRAGRCFGPFRSRWAAESINDAVSALLGLARCPEPESTDSGARLFPDAPGGQLCNRYFEGLCTGPCGGRITGKSYLGRIRLRDRLMLGLDDTPLRVLEERQEALKQSGRVQDADLADVRRAQNLRLAFEGLATTAAAERLVNSLLVMPGARSALRVAILVPDGLRIRDLFPSVESARRLLDEYQNARQQGRHVAGRRLSVSSLDTFCTIARYMRGSAPGCLSISSETLAGLDGATLLDIAFQRAIADAGV